MNKHMVLNPTIDLSEIAGEIRRRLRREKAKFFISQAIIFLLVMVFIFFCI